MSVLIKSMEVPKSCKQCFYKASGCKENKHNNGRPNDCPLVEMPPHGRLIDADCCNGYFYEHMSDDMMIAAMNAINEMPTIIESEGE